MALPARFRILITLTTFALCLGAIIAAALVWTYAEPLQRCLGFQVLEGGNILVTDGGGSFFHDAGSRVFIINQHKRVLWRSRERLRFAHSAIKLSNGNVLVPDTNADRLVELGPDGRALWSSASWSGGSSLLSDGTALDYPNSVQELPDGSFLLSGRYNDRVWELDREGRVLWSYAGVRRQHAPIRLPGGTTLMADSEGNRVIELDRGGNIIWSYGMGLAWPRYAQRLKNGNTLITDSNNDRILEVDPAGQVVFEWGKGILSKPYQAEELDDSSILIADAQHGRLLRVDRSGRILWRYGRPNILSALSMLKGGLANPGAEKADAEGLPAGWTVCDLLAPGDGAWTRDTKVARGGNASFSIEGAQALDANRFWGRFLRARAGQTVVFKGWIRTESVQAGAGLSISFADRSGGVIGGSSSLAVSGDSEWTERVVIAEVPPGAAVVALGLSLIGPGRAWWDDLSLVMRKPKP